MKTRTPRQWRSQLNSPTIHSVCAAADCENAAIHGALCYRHTHQSRQRLAGEHRRLQAHHGALLAAAVNLVDRLRDDTINVDDDQAVTRYRMSIARAVKQLERRIGPPTQP